MDDFSSWQRDSYCLGWVMIPAKVRHSIHGSNPRSLHEGLSRLRSDCDQDPASPPSKISLVDLAVLADDQGSPRVPSMGFECRIFVDLGVVVSAKRLG